MVEDEYQGTFPARVYTEEERKAILEAIAKIKERDRLEAEEEREVVPASMQPIYEAIVAITDRFCALYLNDEYAQRCKKLTAAMCKREPSPLRRGKLQNWACAIVYTLGRVNFLFDEKETPHMKAKDLCEACGVSQDLAIAKATRIRRMFAMIPLDRDWALPSKVADDEMAWMITIDGVPTDARKAPREVQEEAYKRFLIPFMPPPTEEEQPALAEGGEEATVVESGEQVSAGSEEA